MSGLSAVAEIEIDAPKAAVWSALTDPDLIRRYMFGSVVDTDWLPGSPIIWKGEWNGQSYEDKGEVLEIRPPAYLKLTHFSAMSGQEDQPENYHTLEYELSDSDGGTLLRLSQDGNTTQDEVEHATQTWTTMLESLKGVVEERSV